MKINKLILNKNKPNLIIKDLVIWGTNLYSTTNIRYNKEELSLVKLPVDIRSIIIGGILSDGHLALHSKGKNANFILNQALAKSHYTFFVFNYLSHYCQSQPKLSVSYRLNRPSYTLRIATRCMPCITELYDYFYLNKIKIIKSSILFLSNTYSISSLNNGRRNL